MRQKYTLSTASLNSVQINHILACVRADSADKRYIKWWNNTNTLTQKNAVNSNARYLVNPQCNFMNKRVFWEGRHISTPSKRPNVLSRRTIFAYDRRKIFAYDRRTIFAFDRGTIFAYDRRTKFPYDRRTIFAYDRRTIFAYNRKLQQSDTQDL